MLIHGGSRKGRGTTNKIANIHRIIEKAREFQKNNYFSFSDYAKAFDYVNHNKLENSSKDGNTRPPYLPPEKSVCQGCLWSLCLFNLHAEHIMQNAGLDEAQAGIKIAGRNISNLRYADDTTLMAESEEELEFLDESERGE